MDSKYFLFSEADEAAAIDALMAAGALPGGEASFPAGSVSKVVRLWLSGVRSAAGGMVFDRSEWHYMLIDARHTIQLILDYSPRTSLREFKDFVSRWDRVFLDATVDAGFLWNSTYGDHPWNRRSPRTAQQHL